ncbi:MAG: ECF-type sigma factor [Candidatus Krumholzibacteriia bacterium]
MPERADVTSLLLDLDAGDRSAFQPLVTLLYDDLRRLARRHLRLHGGSLTLQTSALVHEAFLKLADGTRLSWDDRGHFLAVYARVMHNIVIDLARRHSAVKRGGDRKRVTLAEDHLQTGVQAEELLSVHEALEHLDRQHPRLARVVECRFFGGLSEEETALALGMTDRTVRRDWVKARTLLRRTLEADGDPAC